MERRTLIAAVAGLVLLAGTVAVLRDESAPPPPRTYDRFLDRGVEYVPDPHRAAAPTDLRLTALDRTSLRVGWTPADGVGHGGFEVRWNDRTRLVRGTETELTDLDPNAEVRVEVRAIDATGDRTGPVTARAVPRLVHDSTWADDLVVPVDLFDGPDALTRRRWRVFDAGEAGCLGLRPFGGRRLEIGCDHVDLQSNVALRFREPGADGVLGRVSLTTDGPVGPEPDAGEVLIALLPDPAHDLGLLAPPFPPGVVVLRITSTGVHFAPGDDTSGTYPPPTPGVRHRWELRVTPGAVAALRDGVEVASEPVRLPWTAARVRLAFRNAKGTLVDAFGIGGLPGHPEPGSVEPLGPASEEGGATSLGAVADSRLAGASSVRVVASVVADRPAPITVELGSRSAPALPVQPDRGLGPDRPSSYYADFPLPAPDHNPRVGLRSDARLTAYQAHLVIADGPDARLPLPRLADRPAPDPTVPPPSVSAVSEAVGEEDRLRLTVELADPRTGEVAAVKGVEVDLDGERIATLPTNGSAGGRHEFLVDRAGLSSGRHEVDVRVLPVDGRLPVRSATQSFQIRPL
ncbi:fibronectin type III domain-containing protein [Actinosynnema sp. NPDC053489]|uniref:fibronectin type III domain-containing protein n=1 Tax=Actinosynnema sp. NPDC053489 TaxID=3363916 RepID=UPI0037C82E03